jgi:hypothetical protein
MMKKLIKYSVVAIVMVVFFIQVLFFFIILIFNLILEKKNLFGCGDNNLSQKGILMLSKNLIIPTKIEFFNNIEIENIFTGITITFIKTKSNLKFNFYLIFYNNYRK